MTDEKQPSMIAFLKQMNAKDLQQRGDCACDPPVALGSKFAKYKLVEKFGEDQTTITYVGEHELGSALSEKYRSVLVKILRAERCRDEAAEREFEDQVTSKDSTLVNIDVGDIAQVKPGQISLSDFSRVVCHEAWTE